MLSVDVSLDKVDNLGPKAVNGVRDYLESGADKGFAVGVDRAPVDRGTLQQNMFSPTWEGNRLIWGVRDVEYAAAMEYGTGPIPDLPITPLLEWGERVLGSREAGAGAWQKIRQEGVSSSPYLRPGRDAQANWYKSHGIQEWIDRRVE